MIGIFENFKDQNKIDLDRFIIKKVQRKILDQM